MEAAQGRVERATGKEARLGRAGLHELRAHPELQAHVRAHVQIQQVQEMPQMQQMQQVPQVQQMQQRAGALERDGAQWKRVAEPAGPLERDRADKSALESLCQSAGSPRPRPGRGDLDGLGAPRLRSADTARRAEPLHCRRALLRLLSLLSPFCVGEPTSRPHTATDGGPAPYRRFRVSWSSG